MTCKETGVKEEHLERFTHKATTARLSLMKEKVKGFFSDENNQKKIKNGILILVGIGATTAIVYLYKDNCRFRNENLKLKGTIDNLWKIIDDKNATILDYIDLCERKDEVFNVVMSDGLRHGSPEAAKQMAFKKDYLKQFRYQA